MTTAEKTKKDVFRVLHNKEIPHAIGYKKHEVFDFGIFFVFIREEDKPKLKNYPTEPLDGFSSATSYTLMNQEVRKFKKIKDDQYTLQHQCEYGRIYEYSKIPLKPRIKMDPAIQIPGDAKITITEGIMIIQETETKIHIPDGWELDKDGNKIIEILETHETGIHQGTCIECKKESNEIENESDRCLTCIDLEQT